MGVDELQQIGWTRQAGVWVAPNGLHEPKARDLKDYRTPGTGTGQRLAPCGTPAAYRRHKARGEDCARCKALKHAQATRAGTR